MNVTFYTYLVNFTSNFTPFNMFSNVVKLAKNGNTHDIVVNDPNNRALINQVSTVDCSMATNRKWESP